MSFLGATLTVVACDPILPDIEEQNDELAGDRVTYPNVVLAISAGENSLFCDDDALDCEVMNQGCQGVPVLGPPDDLGLVMNEGDTIEVTSSCGSFLENGDVDSNEIRIHGSSENPFRAVLETSFDGQGYRSLDEISNTDVDQFDFDFSRVDIEIVRHLRFSIAEGGPFLLDAFEHLQVNPL